MLAILTPIAVGFAFGYAPLGSYLAGAIAAGVLMAVFLANSGGAWDNAKKLVEDGNHGGKGSPAHEATIIGDTVGDPFKDTAGPAINPLIKVMNLVALLIAPTVVEYSSNIGLRVGVALGAVIIVVAAIVVSKRRSSGMGIEVPAATEVGAAVSPAIEGVNPVSGADIADAAARNDAEDRTAAHRTTKARAADLSGHAGAGGPAAQPATPAAPRAGQSPPARRMLRPRLRPGVVCCRPSARSPPAITNIADKSRKTSPVLWWIRAPSVDSVHHQCTRSTSEARILRQNL